MADSERSQDRNDEVPDSTEKDQEVREPESRAGDDPDHRGRDEPDPGIEPWQFWTQLVVEKGLPLITQLLMVWNLVHGNGG